jgi:hypothetical protein
MRVEDKHLGEGSLDPTTGFGANGSLMRASNSGVLHEGTRGVLVIVVVAIVALVAGAIFVLNTPAKLGFIPRSVAPAVPAWAPRSAPQGMTSPAHLRAAP